MRRFAVGVLRIFRRAFGGGSGVLFAAFCLRRIVCGVLRRVCAAFRGGRFAAIFPAFIWRGFGRFCVVLFALFCGGVCGAFSAGVFAIFFSGDFFGVVIRGGFFFGGVFFSGGLWRRVLRAFRAVVGGAGGD